MSGPIEVFHVSDGPRDAPALVLLDSLGSSLEMWDPQVDPLARDYRVVRFDLRGHGRSPSPRGPYEIADLGADVLALMDRLAIDRAHLCGLSLGGMIALWLAQAVPQRVDRLVLCCTSARLEPSEAWTARAATVRAGGTEAVVDAVVGRWFTPPFAASHPDLVARMRAMFTANDAEGYASCCEAIAAMDLRPGLGSVVAPTLLIAGADDPAIPPVHSERIAAAIEGARVLVVPKGAHLPNIEQPDLVTAAILDHLHAADGQEEP
jgi:3-oxoadipate enol-lactonase